MRDPSSAAPAWFKAAIANTPRRGTVRVDDTDIEVLEWGERGQPGVLLIHGYTAHADWWSFTAPLLASGRHVVALSLSGMGQSGWRAAYSMTQHARETMAVAEHVGLFDAPYPPIVVAHSYGSFAARILAQRSGERFGGAVLIDGALAGIRNDDRFDGAPARGHRHRVYASLEQALARFRFEPAQTCANPWIEDFIARTSLGPVTGPLGEPGWSWRFDPDLRAKTTSLSTDELVAPFACRTALMFGDRSSLMTAVRLAFLRKVTPVDAPWIVIPDAGHHVMVDQPLALVAALRSLFAAWQPAATLAADASPR